jgi:hypothetical protein
MKNKAILTFDGKSYELPIIHGSNGEEAIDITNLRRDTGIITFDPGFANTGSCKSSITFMDGEKGILSFINLRYLNDNTQSGQVDFDPNRDSGTTNFWGSEINTERFELSAKAGYVNPEVPWQSLGVQFAFSNHIQDSYFGLNQYGHGLEK